MSIQGPPVIDAYNMIASLADGYLKNRDATRKQRREDDELKAREEFAARVADPVADYRGMAVAAARTGNLPFAAALYKLAASGR
jgi:hypothetical protein